MPTDDHVRVVVLAGGVGSRFWPVSTPEHPKQLLPLAGDRPLISDTIDRARALVPDDRIRILAGEHLAAPFRAALTDFPESGYWIEPRARGTAPVLAWAAWKLAAVDPDAVMVSLHADHLIRPVEAFVESVDAAVEVAARDERLVCIGAVPDRIETGYGHVEPGEPIDDQRRRRRVLGPRVPREARCRDRASLRGGRLPVEHRDLRLEGVGPPRGDRGARAGDPGVPAPAGEGREGVLRRGPRERDRPCRHGAERPRGDRQGDVHLGRRGELGSARANARAGRRGQRPGRRGTRRSRPTATSCTRSTARWCCSARTTSWWCGPTS